MKKIYISLILALSSFLIIFGVGLKVNATINNEFNLEMTIENPIDTQLAFVFTIPKKNDTTNDSIERFIQISWTEIDNSSFTANIYNVVYPSGSNDIMLYRSAVNTNVKLSDDKLYLAHVYPSGQYAFIYLYEVNFIYDNGNIRFDLSNAIYNDNLPYNVDGSDRAISVRFNIYVNLLSKFENRSVVWGGDQLNWVVNNYFNYKEFIYPYIDRAYDAGYVAGHSVGYDDGQAGENAISPIWNLFQGIFGTIGAIFSIELAPHIYIGYFFLVPLFFGVVGLILWIWRRN